MDREIPDNIERFPATGRADAAFGASSGAILGIATALVTARLLQLPSPALHVALTGVIVGTGIGCVAGVVHHLNRESFDTSELGVRLAIAFSVLPSLILFVGAMGFANGTGSVRLVVAIAFAGVMAGLIFGSILDRVYETILQRRSGNDG
tara:strand:+ start:114 stop:563 length:450 start_codon:yes stop_codon:yes gene_type:complete